MYSFVYCPQKFPSEILSRLGHRFQPHFSLKFRNGYELPVVLNAEHSTVCGLSTLYDDFELRGGEMLVFEFDGVSGFNVHVIGNDNLEIEYPNLVHHMQRK